jgi:hypothetical protein
VEFFSGREDIERQGTLFLVIRSLSDPVRLICLLEMAYVSPVLCTGSKMSSYVCFPSTRTIILMQG